MTKQCIHCEAIMSATANTCQTCSKSQGLGIALRTWKESINAEHAREFPNKGSVGTLIVLMVCFFPFGIIYALTHTWGQA